MFHTEFIKKINIEDKVCIIKTCVDKQFTGKRGG